VVAAAQHHRHENATRGNRNGSLLQHVEAPKEVVEHRAVHPGETDGGRNSSPEILLQAQNLNRRRCAYRTAWAEEVASF
jgi:hypothetical protein